MDMKKFLQAVDGVSTKSVVGGNDMRKFLQVVREANLNQPAALPAAPKFSITQTTYDSLNEPPDFTVTDIERGVEVASFDSEQQARAYVTQQDPAGAPQTELHQLQSKAIAPEANPDAVPQSVAEGEPAAQQSPEQIAYNQLRAQLDSATSLRGGNAAYADVSPEVTAATAAMQQKLAQMAAALKLKGIDAEAEYNAADASVPAAAPVNLNKYNDQDAAPVTEEIGMSRLLSIISEGKGPLNRATAAESMTMQHYNAPKQKTITAPVLNVAEGARPSMIGKYFKAVEQELLESEQRNREVSKNRAKKLAERVANKINGVTVVKEEFAQENPEDKITMDVPLLMRVLEHAREDIKDDMALHNVVDRLIELSASGETLTMDNYDAIVGDQLALPAPDEDKDGEEDY